MKIVPKIEDTCPLTLDNFVDNAVFKAFGADADEIIRLGPVDDMGRTTWYAFEPREWGGDVEV